MKQIKIPIGDKYLVVFENEWHDEMPVEICVCLEDQNGAVHQDICMIREHYDIVNFKSVRDPSLIDCLVWGDSDDTDYSHRFTIGVWEDDEE